MLACVFLLGVTVLVLLEQTEEPIADGRKLSYWVNALPPTILTSSRTPLIPPPTPRLTPTQARALAAAPPPLRGRKIQTPFPTDAVAAIRKIGTNAIPHLIPAVYSRDGKFKTWCMKWAGKQKVLKLRSAQERRGHALSALSLLGAEALWSWIEIVTNELALPEVQVYAAQRVSSFGDRATPALSALLMMENHREPRAWSAISWAIQQCDRKGVLPALRNLRQSDDPDLRASAAWSLGFIGDFPDITVPALISVLDDPSDKVRQEAALSLAKYGTNATVAITAMRRLTNDPESNVREAATNALNRIVPAHDANADYKGLDPL